jgi:hypothetical protein
MMRRRSSLSAIRPDSGATSAEGMRVSRKLTDSHTAEPVFA